jgi:hypothetical protein
MQGAYRLHRSIVQALTWRCPGERVVLKDPFHLWCLPALFGAYPDALIVQTHRSPKETLASNARLCAALRSIGSDDVSPVDIATRSVRDFQRGLDSGLRARASRPGSFHDVRYSDLVRQPVREVKRIYEAFGMTWSDEIERRMTRWMENNAHAHRSSPREDAAPDIGPSSVEVKATFAAYCERFQIVGG